MTYLLIMLATMVWLAVLPADLMVGPEEQDVIDQIRDFPDRVFDLYEWLDYIVIPMM